MIEKVERSDDLIHICFSSQHITSVNQLNNFNFNGFYLQRMQETYRINENLYDARILFPELCEDDRGVILLMHLNDFLDIKIYSYNLKICKGMNESNGRIDFSSFRMKIQKHKCFIYVEEYIRMFLKHKGEIL